MILGSDMEFPWVRFQQTEQWAATYTFSVESARKFHDAPKRGDGGGLEQGGEKKRTPGERRPLQEPL